MILPILRDEKKLVGWASQLVGILAQELEKLARPKSQVTTTFTSADGKTITVTNGVITNVS